jgi:hypothetical protein
VKARVISFCFVLIETGSLFVARAGLELVLLLPPSLQCWDYRHVLPGPA